MEAALKAAKHDYRKAKKNDIEERLKFLDTFDPNIRDRLLRTEEQRRKGRVARKITQKLQGGSVSKVIDSDSHGNPIECITKDAIELACISCGKDKYSKTNETPFMIPPLQPLFGYAVDTPCCQSSPEWHLYPSSRHQSLCLQDTTGNGLPTSECFYPPSPWLCFN